MINELLQYQIQITDTYAMNIARVIGAIITIVILFFTYRYVLRLGIRLIAEEENDVYERKLKIILKWFWVFTSLIVLFFGLNLHSFSLLSWAVNEFDLKWDITKEGFQVFKIGPILFGLIIIQMARLLDLIISRILHNNLKVRQQNRTRTRRNITEEEVQRKTNLTIQYMVYGIAILLLINIFNLDFTLISSTGTDDKPGFTLKISDLAEIMVIILIARLFISVVINIFLRGLYRSKNIDIGRQYSFNQLLSYFIYIIAILFAIRSLGYSMTILFGGLAALLVGIGLGLQQTFNDFFSGIILLFERSVEVGQIIQIDNDKFGEVEKIGLRTSVIRDRDNIMRIIPNSEIVNGTIINLSHMDNKSRFNIEFGVAYDTDLQLLEKILFEVAANHDDVLPYPQPQVLFNSISASTFNIRLYFWTTRIMGIRSLRSELRWEVINQTRIHNIEVAYEQYDIRFRNNITAQSDGNEGIRITPISPDKDFSHLKKEAENNSSGKEDEDPA